MPAETIELANNYTQKRFVDLVRNNIGLVNGYRNTCADPRNCYTTHTINLYILITKYQFIYSNYIYYYVHVTIVF